MIDVSKIPPARVLAALYNASRPQGFGFMHFTPEDMTEARAEKLIGNQGPAYFDYIDGRVMKVEIGGATIDPRLYDRDNGPGAAARAIATITK